MVQCSPKYILHYLVLKTFACHFMTFHLLPNCISCINPDIVSRVPNRLDSALSRETFWTLDSKLIITIKRHPHGMDRLFILFALGLMNVLRRSRNKPTSKARRTWWNKTEIKQNCRRPGLRFSRPSTVLFYFSFRMCEHLKLFLAVSVFCFSFISGMCDCLIVVNFCSVLRDGSGALRVPLHCNNNGPND